MKQNQMAEANSLGSKNEQASASEPRSPVTVGLIQGKDFGSTEANLAFTVAEIRRLAEQGAQIICTQELFNTAYFCQEQSTEHFDRAESIPGETSELLSELAKELGVVLVAAYFEKRSSAFYHNTAIVIDRDGRLLGAYRKAHIPQDPGFEEKFYFTPGDQSFPVWDTAFGKIGVLICWDQWFPEAARTLALKGAEILFYPTAIGWTDSEKAEWGERQHRAWESVQVGHAIANACYVATVNRVGRERSTQFWGQSFVSDMYGTLLKRASETETESLLVECSMEALESMRKIWPFFRDRRPELYHGISQQFLESE